MSVFDSPFNQVFRNPFGSPFNGDASSGTTWTPAEWFLASEQGAWYDPSDFTRYMAEKGQELVTNGDFSAGATGWTLGVAGWTIANGKATFSGTEAGYLHWHGSIVAGKCYEFTFTALDIVGTPSVAVYVGNSPSIGTIAASGTYTFRGLATGTVLGFALRGNSTNPANSMAVTNISVRELTAINTATMFQDSAGTTPVTAVEQPVGLVLDKRLGLVEGAELVTNGTFDTNTTGWSAALNSTLSAVSGRLRVTATSSPSLAQYSFATVVGRTYRIRATYTAGTATTPLFRAGSSPLGTEYFALTGATVLGTIERVFVATGTTAYVCGGSGAVSAGQYADFDNISVKELPGNHASQATSASRPVLSARKNLTTNSEAQSGNFGGASSGVTAVDGIARPMGTGRVLRRTTGAASYAYSNAAPTANATIAASCYVRRSDGAPLVFGAPTLANSALNDCVLVINGVGITPNATTVEDAGGGWYRLSASAVYTSSSIGFISYNTTVALDITGLQIEYGSAAGTYQRVNTAMDYDSVGFPLYLKFDGVDDFLVTNSIDFTSTDKVTVVAGVTITSTGLRIIYEHGANPEAGSGFGTRTGTIAAGDLTVTAYSTAVTNRRTDASALPIGKSTVLSHTIDIAGATAADEQQTRLNGITPTYAYSSGTGTGNFTSQIFYIGRRGGTSMSMGGSIHQLVVRGALTADLTPGEAFTAGKTGITL